MRTYTHLQVHVVTSLSGEPEGGGGGGVRFLGSEAEAEHTEWGGIWIETGAEAEAEAGAIRNKSLTCVCPTPPCIWRGGGRR